MTPGDGGVAEGFLEALLDDDAQTLYDRAPCGYLSTTPDGTILKANATFLTLTGYERDELVGRRRFVDLLSAGARIYHETHYAPMLRMQDVAREIAMDLVGADGRRLPVLVNSVLERDGAGHPVVIRTAVFDAALRRSYEEELLREKRRAEASEARARSLARTLQKTLIPPSLPGLPGLEVGVEFRAAGDGSEVGGDFYDVFQAGEADWVVVVGDVSGKGERAALVTALARYTLRSAAMQDSSPAFALTVLNEVLLHGDEDRFCTVFMLRLTRNHGSWHSVAAVAGHPLPLRVNRHGHVSALGTSGTLLGAVDHPFLPEVAHTIELGETLVVFSDGVIEARDEDGTFYGEQRLTAAVRAAARRASAPELAAALLSDVLDFQHGDPRDDIAIVTIKAL
jgi:sigma-B regulation protein RsbU (phosphoserine phosphatase)